MRQVMLHQTVEYTLTMTDMGVTIYDRLLKKLTCLSGRDAEAVMRGFQKLLHSNDNDITFNWKFNGLCNAFAE